MLKKQFVLVPLCLFFLAASLQANIKILHSFTNYPNGEKPQGSLIAIGSTLYGMTFGNRVTSDYGTIFKINKNGTGFATLHSFTGYPDGANGNGNLKAIGSTLYGMTLYGGANNDGTIFKIQTDGTGYSILYNFPGYPSGGELPGGSLIAIGSTLYGMTYGGGTLDDHFGGTVFKINTNGTGFELLHSFSSYTLDEGTFPWGSLILQGSTLYGMTQQGGVNFYGTIFEIQTDGAGYEQLHLFVDDATDGANPLGSLIAKNSTLYGMTSAAGTYNFGTIFKINKNGSGCKLIHSFAGGASDGGSPKDSLVAKGSTLYGMTYGGGTYNFGTIFKINTKGTGYKVLHSFAGGATDGAHPYGSLIVIGSTLYGMTAAGGTFGCGVIFSSSLN